MINQEQDFGVRDSAAEFCLNVMKHNENILLMHLVGIDLRARDYIFKRQLIDQTSMKKSITKLVAVGNQLEDLVLEFKK
jgi:hypothetical protein